MNKLESYGIHELAPEELNSVKGGHPVLVVLGAVTLTVSVGKIMDQATEWFLEGWNNPN